jgi:phosphotriesterase-related protein
LTLVNSVSGALDTADLGMTLSHEHLVVRREAVYLQFPHLYDEARETERAVAQVRLAQERGVKTIFDPSVLGLGRDIRFMARIVELTGIQVIAATGAYTHGELPVPLDSRPVEQVAELFIRDITDGIQATNIKAAFLKCAIDHDGMTSGVEKAIRSVAYAHRATGTPIMVHTSPANRSGELVQDLLADEGVDLGTVIIGHSGDTDDIDYLERLALRGSYLGMDRYGLDDVLPTERRNNAVIEMCRRGYASQLLLSHDHPCTYDRYEPHVSSMRTNWNWAHLFDNVIPALRGSGVTQDAIDLMMVANPRRWIETVSKEKNNE